jgi:hypothetical protein
MLRGGNPDTWNGWVHGIAFLLIIAVDVVTPLPTGRFPARADQPHPLRMDCSRIAIRNVALTGSP